MNDSLFHFHISNNQDKDISHEISHQLLQDNCFFHCLHHHQQIVLNHYLITARIKTFLMRYHISHANTTFTFIIIITIDPLSWIIIQIHCQNKNTWNLLKISSSSSAIYKQCFFIWVLPFEMQCCLLRDNKIIFNINIVIYVETEFVNKVNRNKTAWIKGMIIPVWLVTVVRYNIAIGLLYFLCTIQNINIIQEY